MELTSDVLEDGPLFRATIDDLESKTSHLKQSLKKSIKAGVNYLEATRLAMRASREFTDSLEFIQPIDRDLVHYLHQSEEIIQDAYDKLLAQIEMLVLDPMKGIYDTKIKPCEAMKKDFAQESSVGFIFAKK